MATITDYQAFLDAKRITAPTSGIDVPAESIHPVLFPFQRDVTRWALRKGRSAAFLSTRGMRAGWICAPLQHLSRHG